MTSQRQSGETIDLIAATTGRIAATDNPVSARAMLAGLGTLLERSGLAKMQVEAAVEEVDAPIGGQGHVLFHLFDESGAAAARIHVPHRLFEALYVRLYGGTAAAPATAKPGATQLRYAQRLGRQLCNILDSALPKPDMLRDAAIDAAFDLDEQPEHFEARWNMAFSVAADSIEPCHICFALSDQLADAMPEASGRRMAGTRSQPPQNHMIARAGSVPLIVRSELVAAQMPASRLLNLRPGDVVPIPTPVAIPVTVAGRVFATASIGEWQGSAALRIESFSEGNGA